MSNDMNGNESNGGETHNEDKYNTWTDNLSAWDDVGGLERFAERAAKEGEVEIMMAARDRIDELDDQDDEDDESEPVTDGGVDEDDSGSDANNIWTAVPDDGAHLMTDGGVDSHFEHTCAGLSADNTSCGRGVSADIRATPEYSYCNDHEWQAKFEWENHIIQILPNNQTKRIHVTDVDKIETEWGPVLEIETQYGSVRVSSDKQIEPGCVYDMTVKRSRTDWNQLVLSVKQVEDDD